jgi:uncharacterized SAM-binding protein YcdF (DUF218 family)
MSAQGALRGIGGATVALFAALAFTPLASHLHGILVPPAAPPEPAAAIIVLGSGVDKGVLNDASLRRAVGGVALFRQGLAPLLVMLGPGSRGRPTEADVRVGLAQDLGVPATALLADPRGRTTRDEARVCWEDLAPRGMRRILLVTGSEHMLRAAALFRRAGFEVVEAPVQEMSSTVGQPQARLELARVLLRELVARAYYRVAGYL